jgi:DNA-binding XRE family transcriptional regulator
MKIKPQYVKVGDEQVVVLSAKEYERLAKKADVWEPPLPEPNERGNYPLGALDIVMAQEIIRARRKLGLTQAELARRAGIRAETLNRIEQRKHSPNLRTMQKIDRALKRAQEKNGCV